MGKYNDVFDNFNVQVRKIDFKTALNISLLLCFNDLHFFSDYITVNKLDEYIFAAFEQSIMSIEKRINNLNDTDDLKIEYNKCVDFLNDFNDEENFLYDECVNLCSAIIHLFELIFTKDNQHTLEIMKLCFENKEAFIQKTYDNCDEVIQEFLENMGKLDLSWFNI